MNAQKAQRGRAGLAAAGALALIAMSIVAGTAAQAAPDDFGNIDPDAPASLIIHKHQFQSGTPVTANPDGTVAIPSPPVAGVEFTAYPLLIGGVPIDLTDPTAWDQLAGLVPGAGCTAPAGYTLGTPIVGDLTDADGLSTIDLSVGVFQVCETAAPPEVVQEAAPFIVTLPYPFDDGWVYNVNVYPKNGVTDAVKTILPQTALGLGGVVQFPVTTTVPEVGGAAFTGFAFRDTFDTRLTPAAGGVGTGVLSVTVIDGATRTAVPAANYAVTVTGQLVEVAFTDPAGLLYLAGQAGNQIEVVFQGAVNAVGTDGIPNTASVFVNDPGFVDPIVSEGVTTNWGDARILKTDSAATATALADAVFEVYAATDPYAASCAGATATGAALVVSGADSDPGRPGTQWTTGADGSLLIGGLFVSDSINPSVNSATRCYVVREVQAPAGFVTPLGTAADTAITVTIGETAPTAYKATIQNGQQIVPGLPFTGASGAIILTIAGAGLVALAVGIVVVARRRAARH